MIVLLPPAETKAAGGQDGTRVEAARLGFPNLAASRRLVMHAVVRSAASSDTSTPAKARAAAANAALMDAPVMPAIERYTGVLYDALNARSLPSAAREWVERHVVIHSALFGFVRASDPIPDYKVSHSTPLPGLKKKALWAEAHAALSGEFVLDLRSKAYAQLAPVPAAATVEVVGEDGAALSHWNKHAKGELVRQMALSGIDPANEEDLVAWAGSRDIALGGEPLRLVATATGLGVPGEA